MVLLPDSELTQLKKDIREIVEDTSVNTTIKYRQYTGEDYYDPKSQYYDDPYTDWSGVSAIRGLVTRTDVDRVAGLQISDAKFVVMRSDVSNPTSVTDLVYDTESGTTYNLIQIDYDPLDIVYILYGRKV